MKGIISTYIKYFVFLFSLGLKKLFIYRLNHWIIVLFETINSFALILVIEVVYNNAVAILGWTKYEWYVLFGTYCIQGQIASALYIGGLDSMSNRISSGNLDFLLIKPLSVPFLCLFPNINLHKFYPLPVPIYMVIYGCAKLSLSITPGIWCLYLLFLLMGTILYINFVSITMSLSFWFIKVRSFFSIFFILHDYARQPKDVFNRPLTFIFMFIIPIILFSNPPTFILIGRESIFLCIATICVLILSFFMMIFCWRIGLNKYQSASS